MPMLLTGWKPDDITGPNFLNWATTLRPTAAVCDNESLTERVRMPGGAGTRFKRDAGPGNACGSGALNRGSTRTVPVKSRLAPCRTAVSHFV